MKTKRWFDRYIARLIKLLTKQIEKLLKGQSTEYNRAILSLTLAKLENMLK